SRLRSPRSSLDPQAPLPSKSEPPRAGRQWRGQVGPTTFGRKPKSLRDMSGIPSRSPSVRRRRPWLLQRWCRRAPARRRRGEDCPALRKSSLPESGIANREADPAGVEGKLGRPRAGKRAYDPVERESRRAAEDEQVAAAQLDVGPRSC